MRAQTSFEGRSSWLETAAGVVLFLVWCTSLVGNNLPIEIEWGYPLREWTLWALILLPASGFLVGSAWDFPRWTYPYVMTGVLFSWYLSNASTPGFTLLGIPMFGRELWGWRAWIPFLLAGLTGLLIRRSWMPLRTFWGNAGRDWSVITYGLFGCLPMFAAMMFDEVELSYMLAYILPITVLLVATAVVYLRAGHAALRQVVLAAGSVVTLVLCTLGSILYWNRPSQGGMNLWRDAAHSLGWVLVVLGIMFYPALWARAQKEQSSD